MISATPASATNPLRVAAEQQEVLPPALPCDEALSQPSARRPPRSEPLEEPELLSPSSSPPPVAMTAAGGGDGGEPLMVSSQETIVDADDDDTAAESHVGPGGAPSARGEAADAVARQPRLEGDAKPLPPVIAVAAAVDAHAVHRAVQLSPAQADAVGRALRGESLFITGSAGCGKSVVIRTIARLLPQTPVVTALTGIAALQVNGCTIHGWSGLGFFDPDESLARVQQRMPERARRNWRTCTTLIIDEISMADPKMLEVLDNLGCALRQDSRPFGGMQVILCGDFLQLPPVKSDKLAFHSRAWKRLQMFGMHTVHLTQNFRQTAVEGTAGSGQHLARLLADIRLGNVTDEALHVLGQTSASTACRRQHVKLRPTRNEVEKINQAQFDQLRTPAYTYKALDTGAKSSEQQWPVDDVLKLRVGTRVMLRKNLGSLLVNGSCGVVEEIHPIDRVPMDPDVRLLCRRNGATHIPAVRFDGWATCVFVTSEEFEETVGGSVRATRLQMPLSQAWAMTIHKAQGMTLSFVDVDLRAAFTDGQAYVALSRARTLDGLYVTGFDRRTVRANPSARGFYARFQERSTGGWMPDVGDRLRDAALQISSLDRRRAEAPVPQVPPRLRAQLDVC